MSLPSAAMETEFGGERLLLLAQRAVVWPREKTLFVADVHLGKAASFRAAGIPVPSGHSSRDLARLSALIQAHDITHLVILGDLVHNRASYTVPLDESMRAFAAAHPFLKKTLITGNHDNSAGQCPTAWGVKQVDEQFSLEPFLCIHTPENWRERESLTSFGLAGHLHPGARLQTAREALVLPCFWQQQRLLVLPSFGSLTGRYLVTPEASDVTFVVTGQHIFRLPPAA